MDYYCHPLIPIIKDIGDQIVSMLDLNTLLALTATSHKRAKRRGTYLKGRVIYITPPKPLTNDWEDKVAYHKASKIGFVYDVLHNYKGTKIYPLMTHLATNYISMVTSYKTITHLCIGSMYSSRECHLPNLEVLVAFGANVRLFTPVLKRAYIISSKTLPTLPTLPGLPTRRPIIRGGTPCITEYTVIMSTNGKWKIDGCNYIDTPDFTLYSPCKMVWKHN
jgi:hypothetical protein